MKLSRIQIDYFPVVITLLLLLLVNLPYLVAFQVSDPDYIFAGAFLNLQDANSYLAKMHQGWSGSWRYTLPFTAEPGQGAYLFLFYLSLGHIARIFGWSLLFTYHFARVLGTLFLSITIWFFYRSIFTDRFTYRVAFLTAMLGAGMGWVLLLFGYRAVDFWGAQLYPFLSAFVNPHFPIGLGLILLLIIPRSDLFFFSHYSILYFLGALLLALINPFGAVMVCVIFSGLVVIAFFDGFHRKIGIEDFILGNSMLHRLFWIILGALPVIFYDFLVLKLDLILSGWNIHTQTAPLIWDLIISLSPIFILAVYAVTRWYGQENIRLLAIWFGFALVFGYLPINLQRRFMIGLYIPIAGLAAYALTKISSKGSRTRLFLFSLIFVTILPTNILIIMGGLSEAYTRSSRIYLSSDDVKALEWVSEFTSPDSLVLAGPKMGMYIPAFTGRRVIYGHGLETVNADEELKKIMDYFSGAMTAEKKVQFYEERGIDFLYYGPHEQNIGPIEHYQGLSLIYKSEHSAIYQVVEVP